jgi:hypothetical protein
VHKLPVELPGVFEIAQWHRSRAKDEAVKWFLGLLLAEVANVDSCRQHGAWADRWIPQAAAQRPCMAR